MRLFVALNFTDGEKDALEGLQALLKEHSAAGNYTRRQNLHMTLSFLGELPPERIPILRKILKITGDRTSPFVLQYDRMGYFSGKGQEKLWYLSCGTTPELDDLVTRLQTALFNHGFSLEERTFLPHVTLCRRCITDLGPHEVLPMEVRFSSMELMLSEHIDGILTYTPIFSAPFSCNQTDWK